MLKFKMSLQKELLTVGDVLVLLTGDKSFHAQGLLSAVYSIVSMHHGKVVFMLNNNGYRHLVGDLEDRIFPGHNEGAYWIIKYL